MLLIFLYYLFLFINFIPSGVLFMKIFKKKESSLGIILLGGIIFQLIFFTVFSFFSGVSVESLTLISFLNLGVAIRYRSEIFDLLKNNIQQFKKQKSFSKYVFAIGLILIILKSIQLPYLIDNESYYIQTIKWSNAYGIVKGLANLHPFFAQFSSWHILQAGLNFDFFTYKINDLNGFVMLTFMLLTLDKKLNQNQMISIGLLFSWILVFFIDTPSPDLPIILFSFLAFSIYYNQLKSYYWFAILLLISSVFIKITLAPLLILLLFLMRKKRNIFYTLFFASLCTSIWMLKNHLISGYPFYPLNIQFSEVDWTMNEKIFLHFLDFSSTQNFELKSRSIVFLWCIYRFIHNSRI